jgi:hypothetical protein
VVASGLAVVASGMVEARTNVVATGLAVESALASSSLSPHPTVITTSAASTSNVRLTVLVYYLRCRLTRGLGPEVRDQS